MKIRFELYAITHLNAISYSFAIIAAVLNKKSNGPEHFATCLPFIRTTTSVTNNTKSKNLANAWQKIITKWAIQKTEL